MEAFAQAIDGGLEMGVQSVLGGTVAWHAEIDPGASRILAHHWPDVPNLGDLTAIDYRTVPPVDVLTAGFPCQPVSHAGKRAGITDERWLFDDIIRALRELDPPPRLLVLENVIGLLTANRGDAMARVIEGLASVGYVGRWRTLRASDVGACHRRERVFIVARPTADAEGDQQRDSAESRQVRHEPRASVGSDADGASLTLLKTPTAQLAANGGSQNPDKRRAGGHGPTLADEVEHMLPTPKVTDSHTSSPGDLRRNAPGLRAVMHWLPTPRATDGTHGGPNQRGSSGDLMLPSAVIQRFGDYAPAIARHEAALGRPAPDPTEPAPRGGRRLSPAFVEWMMMLPAGHVTGVGLSRNAQLRALGNGVVPPQAAAAVASLLNVEAVAA